MATKSSSFVRLFVYYALITMCPPVVTGGTFGHSERKWTVDDNGLTWSAAPMPEIISYPYVRSSATKSHSFILYALITMCPPANNCRLLSYTKRFSPLYLHLPVTTGMVMAMIILSFFLIFAMILAKSSDVSKNSQSVYRCTDCTYSGFSPCTMLTYRYRYISSTGAGRAKQWTQNCQIL